MRTWKSVLALSAIGALLATTAMAQTTSPPPAPKAEPSKPDASSPSSSSPSTSSPSTSSPSTSSPSATSPSTSPGAADKSDTMKSSRATKGGGNQEQVRAAQQALKDKGNDPGPIDGVLGAKTQAALRDFQKKEGLKESGRLDAQTLAKLGVESSSPAASPQTGASPSAPSSEMGKGSSSSKSGSGSMGKTDSGMKDKDKK